ncbi:MAG: CPBP family intramembrane metalloprotease [SAR324 cluster bacterium]|nr:CPBP family intramembrane metalloprotease [SAR324 cluster bacterium]
MSLSDNSNPGSPREQAAPAGDQEPAGGPAAAAPIRPGEVLLPFPPWGLPGSMSVLVVFVLTQLAVAAAVAAALKFLAPASGGAPPDALNALKIGLPASVVISHLAGWLAIYLLVVKRHGLSLLDGLRLRQPAWWQLLRAFLGGLLLQVLGAVLVFFAPPPPDFVFPIERFLMLGRWALWVLFLMAVVMAPLLEEALFRGLLLPALRRRFRFGFSALLVTAIFTALHATQSGSYWPPLLGIALCGFFLAWLRERTGSLWPSIAFHMGFNFTALIPLILLELLGGSALERLAAG